MFMELQWWKRERTKSWIDLERGEKGGNIISGSTFSLCLGQRDKRKLNQTWEHSSLLIYFMDLYIKVWISYQCQMTSVLGLVLFNNFLTVGIECTFSRFAGDPQPSGVVDTLQGREAIQRELGRLERWVNENLMMFNQGKCKVLKLDWGFPNAKYRLGEEWFESSPGRKTWECWLMRSSRWDSSVCLQPRKPNMSWSSSRDATSRSREVIPPLYPGCLRHHLQYCVQLWGSQRKKDMLERVQRRP